MSRAVRVCFVCLGNICRSPTALGVMRHLVSHAGLASSIRVDSAGTSDFHVGEPPDRRSNAAAVARGYRLDHSAWQFKVKDFDRFDYVVAMDQANRDVLLALAPDLESRTKVRLLRSYDPTAALGAEVPDPYYGGPSGFDEVLDICEASCAGLLAQIREEHGL